MKSFNFWGSGTICAFAFVHLADGRYTLAAVSGAIALLALFAALVEQ